MPRQKIARSLTRQKKPKSIGNTLPSAQTLLSKVNRSTNQFNPYNNFANSIRRKRYGAGKLKEIAQTILFDRAIERISNGVAGLIWTVQAPEKESENEIWQDKAKKISDTLHRPNFERHNTYRKLVKSLVRDLLVFGTAVVERQPGIEKARPFFLWPTDVEVIKSDPDWEPAVEGQIPRFWYAPKGLPRQDWQPIYNKNMFLIQARVSSYEEVSPSPVQLAYDDMQVWLNLHEYQQSVVSNAVRDYMISLEDASQDDLEAFRDYWNHDVVGMGETPIWSGKVNVVKFGARNDAELFPAYTEYLTGLIALEFGLSRRDFDYAENQTYATAGVAADTSFQEAILPIAQCIIEHFHWEVVDFYEPGCTIKLADTEPRKEIEEAQRADTIYKGNLGTRNETRAMLGLPAIKTGNKFADGSTPDKEAEPPPEQAPPPNGNIPSQSDPTLPQQSQNQQAQTQTPESEKDALSGKNNNSKSAKKQKSKS